MLNYKERYLLWKNSEAFDPETRRELAALTEEKEMEDRFYKDLEFGTAGLRGIMGAGTNRINSYTIGRATKGLATYLIRHFPDAEKRGVVIGYDTRNRSAELARCAADTLTAMGLTVRLYDQPVPTPVLSFSVREFGCVAGIVLTASHNPPQYNGYKVYDENGCQLGIEAAEEVLAEINAITDWSTLPTCGREELLTFAGDRELELFVDTVLLQSALSDTKAKEDLKLVYTPIHGTGRKPVLSILKKDGFTQVHTVSQQELPDGNFPTVKSPNPEERGALQMGIALAEEIGADLVIGTDPDADRTGCAVMHQGKMRLLTGNQVGALLVDFLLSTKPLPPNPVVVSTIVTGDLGSSIARAKGCEVHKVLTGFKFIGEKINAFQKEQEERSPQARHYVFGYEESYGYLAGTHARDKDAVVASMLLAEMAAYHKKEGRTLWDALENLWKQYGYCLDTLDSFTLQGKEGLERIGEIMDTLRRDPHFLPGVQRVLDYSQGVEDLPRSNVLKFDLGNSSWVAARPSGTEPKIKFYYSVRADHQTEAEKILTDLKERIRRATGL